MVVLITLLCSRTVSLGANESAVEEKHMIGTDELLAKGGLGIVDENLYVDVRSAKNELVLRKGDKWSGRSAHSAELVIFFEGKVWLPGDLPDGFDLAEAVVISFERDRIRFFDFRKGSGGYYRRR